MKLQDRGKLSPAVCLLAALSLALSIAKAVGVVSWSWLAVTFPIMVPVYFFAAVGAIVGGALAAIFVICEIDAGLRP